MPGVFEEPQGSKGDWSGHDKKTGQRGYRGGEQSNRVGPNKLLKGLWLLFYVKWEDVAGFNQGSDITSFNRTVLTDVLRGDCKDTWIKAVAETQR